MESLKASPLKGSLAEKNPLELLIDCHREARTGLLRIKRRQMEKSILLKEGSILRAQSNMESEKLGQILLKKNLISPWDLEVALTQVNDTNQRLGSVLLHQSSIKEAVLNQTLVTQTRDIIFTLVDWEDGEFVLDELAELEKEVQFDQLYTPELILQGMRRISNIVLLLRPLGDMQGILSLAPDYLERIRKLTLLTEEKSVLARLNKPQTLKDLIKSSGMEKLTVYRSVAGLLAVDVMVQDGLGVASPQTAAQEAEINLSGRPASDTGTRALKHRRNLLGEMLVGQKVITEQQLREALVVQSSKKDKKKEFLGNVLVSIGHCTEEAIVSCLSSQMKIPSLEEIHPADDIKKTIPLHVAKKYAICPVRKHGTTLEVAMLDPTNMAALDDLSFLTSLRIQPLITTNQALKDGWNRVYGYTDEKGVQRFQRTLDVRRDLTFRNFSAQADEETEERLAMEELQDDDPFDMGELEALVSGVVEELQLVSPEADVMPGALDVDNAPVVRLVNTILRQAIKMGASDIHLEPGATKLQVRFRLDGVLHKVFSFPISISNALVSRVKIISQLDIAERRRPQDGRVILRIGKKRTVEFRVSVVPSVHGERIVLRVLDRASLEIDMTKLGFDPLQMEYFKKAINQPYGMILCTGPTGSGKTTTLYSAVNSLDHATNNIMTVEEPVEYDFPGICQVQVNEQIGVTFANALRAFLRQDPDIIMVGEVRDQETAEICAKAALTGHLVLSTVHTNDAPSAVGRLIDLGLKPYLISASLLMVIAQRLVRRICKHCKTEISVDKQILIDAGMSEEDVEKAILYKGLGCDACGGTGFLGRTAIFEIMSVTRAIKSAVAADLPMEQIRDLAINEGMKDLRHAALEKVKVGITTLEEAIQNTMQETT